MAVSILRDRRAGDHALAALARRALPIATSVTSGEGHGAISFGSGHASPSLLPDMRDAAERALSDFRAETLQYGPRLGTLAMREWLCERLAADDVRVSSTEIIITNGAKNGLELLCRLLIDEGDAVVVTAPTYFTAIPIFRSFGVQFIEVGQDQDGLNVDELRSLLKTRRDEGQPNPKFIYNVPEFHNPTGKTMPEARRIELVELARTYGTLIVEDSPYRSVRFEGATQRSMKSLDPDGRVIGLGTFAKLLAPGLRVGWVVAPEQFVARMAQLKCDGGTCPLTQRMIVEFCKAGELEAHAERVRATYRQHRDAMIRALERHLPDASMVKPEGGYYLWVSLPPHVDGDRLASAAAQHQVDFVPGSKFYAGANASYPNNQGAPKNHIRLAYSEATPNEIDEGVSRIARAYRAIAA